MRTMWALCQNVPVLVSVQNLRPAQDAEALAHAVLQGKAIIPESLVQGQQQFEDLRDIRGEDIEENVQRKETRKDHHMVFWRDHRFYHQSLRKRPQQQQVGLGHLRLYVLPARAEVVLQSPMLSGHRVAASAVQSC